MIKTHGQILLLVQSYARVRSVGLGNLSVENDIFTHLGFPRSSFFFSFSGLCTLTFFQLRYKTNKQTKTEQFVLIIKYIDTYMPTYILYLLTRVGVRSQRLMWTCLLTLKKWFWLEKECIQKVQVSLEQFQLSIEKSALVTILASHFSLCDWLKWYMLLLAAHVFSPLVPAISICFKIWLVR